MNPNNSNYLVQNLEPYSRYQFQIEATYDGGAGKKTSLSSLIYTNPGSKLSFGLVNIVAIFE